MGGSLSQKKGKFEILVKTGDVKGSGTDSNVFCRLIDGEGNSSPVLPLDCMFRNDFENGNLDSFKISNVHNVGTVQHIQLWRDSRGMKDDWFVEVIKVRKIGKAGEGNREWKPFPINRWIESDKEYTFALYDSILPQCDKHPDQRERELVEKRSTYSFEDAITGIPRKIKECPKSEKFSTDYQWDIIGRQVKYLAQKKLQTIFNKGKWNSLEDLLDVYKGTFGIPRGYYDWRSDQMFGQQRLTGCNPTLIKRCQSIPTNFAVCSDMVEPFLDDDMTLEDAMKKKLIYMVDLGVLEGIHCKDDHVLCCPFALFYRKTEGPLVPIAIQLFQQPSEDNPVFLPNDPEYTWMLAKMFYNNADCAHHQACSHLGFTHFLCESICVSVHQSLSPSHPVFRLLAPHFLYLIAINDLAVTRLLAEDGWVDRTMTMGTCGLLEIVQRMWKSWKVSD